MKRCTCKLRRTPGTEELQLDVGRNQPVDTLCIPVGAVDDCMDEAQLLTVEIHTNESNKVVTLRCQAIREISIALDVGRKPFPGCLECLEERCYVVPLAIAERHSDTIDVQLPTRRIVTQPRRRRIQRFEMTARGPPLPRLWLARTRAVRNELSLPTATQAEEALRLYCTALCLYHDEEHRAEAFPILDALSDEQEMTGMLLWRGLVRPQLERIVTERMDCAETAIRRRRVDHYSTTAPVEILENHIRAASAFTDLMAERSVEPWINEYINILEPGNCTVYSCRWEDALEAVKKRACILVGGTAYLSIREAWRVVSRSAEALPPIVPETRFASAPDNYVIPELRAWITHVAGSITAAIKTFLKLEIGVDLSRRERALSTGPLCALRLTRRLAQTGHLFFDQRKQILAILVDCGYSGEEAIVYVWNRMSNAARTKCKLVQLEGAVKSYLCDKTTGELRHPATRTCAHYAGVFDKHGTGCPWRECSDGELAELLRLQAVDPVDVEDLVDARRTMSDYVPMLFCRMHFVKLARDSGRVPPSRIFHVADFVKGLYPAQ